MRKAIQLKVTLWIQGEQDAPENYFLATKKFVEEVFKKARVHPPITRVTIKRIEEQNEDERALK